MSALLQINDDMRRSKSVSVAPHTRAKPPRFSPEVTSKAGQLKAEIDADYVLAVAGALTEAFPGDLNV